MNIHYRRLTPTDAKEYRQIRLESLKNYPENFGSTFEDESKKPKLGYEEYIEQEAADKFIIGAFDNDRLIGICGFFPEQKIKCRHIGMIIQMYVKEAYNGQGIGLALLRKTIEESFKIEGIEQLILGFVANNISANKIYENAGFIEYGVHKKHFKEGTQYSDQRFMVLYKEDYKSTGK